MDGETNFGEEKTSLSQQNHITVSVPKYKAVHLATKILYRTLLWKDFTLRCCYAPDNCCWNHSPRRRIPQKNFSSPFGIKQSLQEVLKNKICQMGRGKKTLKNPHHHKETPNSFQRKPGAEQKLTHWYVVKTKANSNIQEPAPRTTGELVKVDV